MLVQTSSQPRCSMHCHAAHSFARFTLWWMNLLSSSLTIPRAQIKRESRHKKALPGVPLCTGRGRQVAVQYICFCICCLHFRSAWSVGLRVSATETGRRDSRALCGDSLKARSAAGYVFHIALSTCVCCMYACAVVFD